MTEAEVQEESTDTDFPVKGEDLNHTLTLLVQLARDDTLEMKQRTRARNAAKNVHLIIADLQKAEIAAL